MGVHAARVGRRVLREEVKDYLIDAILRGELRADDRVVETRVAQQLSVSQGPVREALRDLELFGFVVSSPFRGTRVRHVTVEELVQVYPIRAALEGEAARSAAARVDNATLGELEAILGSMRQAAARGIATATPQPMSRSIRRSSRRRVMGCCGSSGTACTWRRQPSSSRCWRSGPSRNSPSDTSRC